MNNSKNLLVEILRCPYCGDKFKYKFYGADRFNNGYGLFVSGCGEFPVIADIPILKLGRIGNHGETVVELINKIKGGEYEQTLMSMIVPKPMPQNHTPDFLKSFKDKKFLNVPNKIINRIRTSRWKKDAIDRAINRFTEISYSPSVEEMLRYYFMENGNDRKSTFEYFFYRYGKPLHVTAIGILPIIHNISKPIVEIGCGFGHLTREISKRINNSLVVGVDKAFYALYVAKKMMATEAEFICFDVNYSIPFEDGTFYAAIVIDGIHYIDQKFNTLCEMKRIISDDGVIMLISSRNVNVRYKYGGFPLTPEGYKTLIGNMPHRIMADRDVVISYLEDKGADLKNQKSLKELKDEPLLSIVASNDETKFKSYDLFGRYSYVNKKLSLNPMYRPIETDNKNQVLLQRTIPLKYNEYDSFDGSIYLPEKVYVDKEYFHKVNNEDSYRVKSKLIDRFVYLDLPDKYCKKQYYK